MVRNKHISDEGTSNSRRESSYRGRGRGRGRGRYSKNYRGNYHNSSDQSDYPQQHYKSKNYADNRSYPEDEDQYEEQITARGESMEDLYDDRPNQDNMEGVNEGRSLQDRISMPKNDHYSGHEGADDHAMVSSI